jgi:hypothetical protein
VTRTGGGALLTRAHASLAIGPAAGNRCRQFDR